MVNFALGKIYCMYTGGDKMYIGSTCDSLNNRLSKHKAAYKQHLKNNYRYCASFDLIKKEENDVKITLLEDYPCDTRAALWKRESEWIDMLKKNVCNKKRPAVSKKKAKQISKPQS